MINKPQPAVPEYLLEIARDIYAQNKVPEIARTETTVTLRRRFRAAKKSDLLGHFNPLLTPGSIDGWSGDGPEQEMMMNMYGFHVVKPVIRANQSAMVQAEVECTVKPTSKNPTAVGAASIGTGVYKFLNGHADYWSNNLKGQIAQQSHTDPGYLIHTYFDPNAESPINIVLDEYSDTPEEQAGEYACAHCGSEGPMFTDQMQVSESGTMRCLNDECGEQAEIMAMPEMAQVDRFKNKREVPAGNIVQEVVSALQIRVDERKTKNGQLRRADWLEHHFLMHEDDLQAMVPYFDIESASEWSYPLKWEYALETGVDFRLQPWRSDGLTGRKPLHEVRRIYMRPGKYRHYRAPADFTLDRGDGHAAVNRKGEPMLQIKRGQKLLDLFPNGFYFVVSSDRLLPYIEPCDLRDEWAYGGFLNDSASFWYLPAVELEELQRGANNLYTIKMQHLETSSMITTHYDREMFDSDDFERGLSPTKEGSHLLTNDAIRNHIHTTTPPNLTGVSEGLEFLRSIVPDVSGVQPPMTGGSTGANEPYAKYALQRQASLGMLTPAQQSMAECKACVVMQHLKFAQKTKPYEWFEYLAGLYGEEWKRADIDAFLNSNLELVLVVDYKKGTEVPSTLIEQEMKYRQALLDVTQAAQYVEGLIDVNMVKEMISKATVSAGLDFDFDNVEADQRLADARFQKIKAWLAENKDNGMPEPVLVELALADRSLKPTSGEDNETHIELYQDHIRALIAVEDPDYALISCCEGMVDRHNEGIKDQKQTKSENEIEGAAPEIAAQVAAQQAQAQAEAQAEQQRLQVEAAAREQEAQAAMERQAITLEAKAQEGEKKRAHDAAQNAEDRALKAVEIATKGKETVAGPEPPIDPIQSIAESIDYSELPVPAQTDMLRRVGLPATGVRDVHPVTVEKAQIAASKAKANRPSNGASK